MRCTHLVLASILVESVWLSAAAAQKPKPQPKAPTGPPMINPAVARLEQTATSLDAPGVALAVNDSRGLLLVGCEDHTVRLWMKDGANALRIQDVAPHVLRGHAAPVTAVAAADSTVASASVDGKILLWAIPGDKVQHTLTAGAPVRALAVSPDGKTLAAGGDDGAIQLWEAASGKPVRKLTGATDWLLALAFSPDGKTLAAGGHDGQLRLWDVASGRKVADVLAQPPAAPKAPPPPVNIVSALAFSPDGKQVALGGSDTRIHFFSTDGKLVRTLTGHTAPITALVFHPAGAVLISASKDRTLRLWNPTNGQMLKSLEGHTAWVQGAALLEQGTRLASVGADRTVRLWALTPEEPKKK
jgi:WD40 repeat protein